MSPLDRCPACRARLTGDEAIDAPCRRCAADLASVRRAERQATHAQARARRALADGDALGALVAAHHAHTLVDEPSTRATLRAALYLSARHRGDA